MREMKAKIKRKFNRNQKRITPWDIQLSSLTSLVNSTTTPSDGTCLGEPPVRFLWCWLLFLIHCCFCDVACCLFLRFWTTFPCHRHSTLASQAREGFCQLWALPWLLSIALLFRHIFIASATVLSGHFLPTGVFFLTLLPHIFSTTCFYQDLPGSRQFFFEVCRASCWASGLWSLQDFRASSKHRPGPSACLIHSNPQSWYSEESVFKSYQIFP